MTTPFADTSITRKPIRLWPGVAAALLLALAWFGIPIVVPGSVPYRVLGAFLCAIAIIVWWVFFSRVPWRDRLVAVVLMILGLFAGSRLVHETIANGMMGLMYFLYAIPLLCFALVVWAVATCRISNAPRRAALVLTIVLACGVWTILRTEGVTGGGSAQLHWRWVQSPEERLLAQAGSKPQVPAPVKVPEERPAARTEPSAPATAKAPEKQTQEIAGVQPPAQPPGEGIPLAVPEWPGFRGLHRDGSVPGVRIRTDWAAAPPVVLWRRPVGPGWSSFSVRGERFYTQEQRGEEEVVACYSTTTGKPVWEHRDAARFWESNGGAGPRATPTLSGGSLYSFGATGILNALSADNGSVLWSRIVTSDTGSKVPYWGLSSSPLVAGDLVIVYADKLSAYETATGRPRWLGTEGGVSYSSPELMTIGGILQVLMLTDKGMTSVSPADGAALWQYAGSSSIVQPARIADGELMIAAMGAAGGTGTRRISVAHGPGGWKAEERWTSTGLKPYFNDFVIHKGHAFGFDGGILACIDLQDGKRKWKGGRYGYGQMILLPDQDLLLVLSEEGELAAVAADPAQFKELARFQAIEGKTWNHPVLARDILLVRNGQEMTAIRLSPDTK